MKSAMICPSSPAPAPTTWTGLVVGAVDDDARQQLVEIPLIGNSVRAGLVDLDEAEASGQYPAGIAWLSGNGHAAAAALDLGCRLDLAASGTGHPDIITAARACMVSHCLTETVALVTAAVMRRQIKNALPVEASTSQTGRGARRPSV